MKQGGLQGKARDTFKWIKNRATVAEQLEKALNTKHKSDSVQEQLVPQELIKLSDKGRVRRIKEKVWKVLERPTGERKRMLDEVWMKKFDVIKPPRLGF